MTTGAPKGACPRNDNARRQPGDEGSARQTNLNENANAPGKKWEAVLRHLLSVGSLNRFEAERIVNDHCLHTTVASLRRDFGIECGRKFECVRCLKGRAMTRVKRYWLDPDPENVKRARAALAQTGGAAK